MAPSLVNNVFVVRHGERLDHVMKMWRPDPAHGIWDPPLSTKGHDQAYATGRFLGGLLHEQEITSDKLTVVVYTSPFLRCIETTMGIVRGLSGKVPVVLRLETGLGEWMCEKFFDEVCPASRLVARHYENLARKQATAYANKNASDWPSYLTVDYGYRFVRTEFDYPERYGDMLNRFDEVRRACLEQTAVDYSGDVVVIFVTHAVGLNAIMDSFREQMTRPVETGYCSVSHIYRDEDENQWVIDELGNNHCQPTSPSLSPI